MCDEAVTRVRIVLRAAVQESAETYARAPTAMRDVFVARGGDSSENNNTIGAHCIRVSSANPNGAHIHTRGGLVPSVILLLLLFINSEQRFIYEYNYIYIYINTRTFKYFESFYGGEGKTF